MSFKVEAFRCDVCDKLTEADGCPSIDTHFDRVHKKYDLCKTCGSELCTWIMARHSADRGKTK